MTNHITSETRRFLLTQIVREARDRGEDIPDLFPETETLTHEPDTTFIRPVPEAQRLSPQPDTTFIRPVFSNCRFYHAERRRSSSSQRISLPRM